MNANAYNSVIKASCEQECLTPARDVSKMRIFFLVFLNRKMGQRVYKSHSNSQQNKEFR